MSIQHTFARTGFGSRRRIDFQFRSRAYFTFMNRSATVIWPSLRVR